MVAHRVVAGHIERASVAPVMFAEQPGPEDRDIQTAMARQVDRSGMRMAVKVLEAVAMNQVDTHTMVVAVAAVDSVGSFAYNPLSIFLRNARSILIHSTISHMSIGYFSLICTQDTLFPKEKGMDR